MSEVYTREELWELFRAQHLRIARRVREGVKPDPIHAPHLPVHLELQPDGQLAVSADVEALHEYTRRQIVEALPWIIEAFLDEALTTAESHRAA